MSRACALPMDRAGWDVIDTVRKPEDAGQLRIDPSGHLCTMLLEAANAGRIAVTAGAFGERVADAGLHGTVDNAGVHGGGLPGSLEPG